MAGEFDLDKYVESVIGQRPTVVTAKPTFKNTTGKPRYIPTSSAKKRREAAKAAEAERARGEYAWSRIEHLRQRFESGEKLGEIWASPREALAVWRELRNSLFPISDGDFLLEIRSLTFSEWLKETGRNSPGGNQQRRERLKAMYLEAIKPNWDEAQEPWMFWDEASEDAAAEAK